MKKLFFLAMIIVSQLCSIAQAYEASNVKRISTRAIGPILTFDELVGYRAFFEVETTDKKQKKYRIDIVDNNLNKAKEFFVTQDSKSYLLEVVFNGECFLIVFWTADRTLEYITMDKEGKQLGKFIVAKPNKYDRMRIDQQIVQPDVENVTSFAIPGQGFVKLSWVDNDKLGYEILALNQRAVRAWSFASAGDSKEVETADIINVDENYVLLNVARKKSLMSKDFSTFLIALDSKTGAKVFEIPMKSIGGSDINLLNTIYDSENKKFVLIGELYAPGDEPFKDQSAGLFIQELNTDGEVESTNQYLWDKEIKRAKVAGMTEEQKESEKKSALFIHKAIIHKDGSLTLIGEQYKKAVSALGIAAAVAGGGGGVMEMVIMNMVVMQFDAEKQIKSYRIIDKKLSRVNLPGSYSYASSAILARYLEAAGFFDYSFTSGDRMTDTYTVVYSDANRREEKGGDKNDAIIGVIEVKNGEVSTSRVPFNTNASSSRFFAAKPGYVAIYEYFKKEKRMKLRMESLKK
jgi:hypothetical protein